MSLREKHTSPALNGQAAGGRRFSYKEKKEKVVLALFVPTASIALHDFHYSTTTTTSKSNENCENNYCSAS